MSCGVGHRRISDPALLWLWLAAVALIGPLAWESSHATGAALKRQKKRKETDPGILKSVAKVHLWGFPKRDSLEVFLS